MNLVSSPGKPLHGSLTFPGDKSLSHRAALFSALAQGESVIDNFLVAGVTQAMLDVLTPLGVSWELRGKRLVIQGKGLEGLRPPGQPLNCGNSATTIRLLAGALAAAGVPAVLDGSPGLRRRPMDRIVSPLQSMGVQIWASEGGCAPLQLEARPAGQHLRALDYTMPVASAQVKTCLLLAALVADGPFSLHEPEPSRDHSERMLASMRVNIGSEGGTVTLVPSHPVLLNPLQLVLPGDISSAAFILVAALITPGSQVILRDVLHNPTRTGLLDALQSMGADIRIQRGPDRGGEPLGDMTVTSCTLHGTEVDGSLAVRMIDEFPAFAVAAAFAHGRTVVRGADELRHKESDRIGALVHDVRLLGAQAEEATDGFTILGRGMLQGGKVDSFRDHRLGMALAVAGLASKEAVTIQGAEIIAESYPEFASALRSLGAELRLEP